MKHTLQGPTLDSVVSVISPSAATVGSSLNVGKAGGFAIGSIVTVDTNAAGTFAAGSLSSNHVTITSHGYKTGLVGQLTTAGGLPTGLSTSTNYYIIAIDANTVKFASSYANTIAGTAIAISGGSGNSTFTPTALASAALQWQWSVDGTNWINDGSPVSITTSANIGAKQDRPPYAFYRASYTIATGSLTISNTSITSVDNQ